MEMHHEYKEYLDYLNQLEKYYDKSNMDIEHNVVDGVIFYKNIKSSHWTKIVPPVFTMRDKVIADLVGEKLDILKDLGKIQKSLMDGDSEEIKKHNDLMEKITTIDNKIMDLKTHVVPLHEKKLTILTDKRLDIQINLDEILKEKHSLYKLLDEKKETDNGEKLDILNKKYSSQLTELKSVTNEISNLIKQNTDIELFNKYKMVQHPIIERKAQLDKKERKPEKEEQKPEKKQRKPEKEEQKPEKKQRKPEKEEQKEQIIASTKCQCTTKKGDRCSKNAVKGSKYCKIHENCSDAFIESKPGKQKEQKEKLRTRSRSRSPEKEKKEPKEKLRTRSRSRSPEKQKIGEEKSKPDIKKSDSTKCQCTTKKGDRCSKNAVKGSKYCKIHENCSDPFIESKPGKQKEPKEKLRARSRSRSPEKEKKQKEKEQIRARSRSRSPEKEKKQKEKEKLRARSRSKSPEKEKKEPKEKLRERSRSRSPEKKKKEQKEPIKCKDTHKNATIPGYVCNPSSGLWVMISGVVGKRILSTHDHSVLKFSKGTKI